MSVVNHIKYANMVSHNKNLKMLDMDNFELQEKITKMEDELKSVNKKNEKNPTIPNEIMNNINKKPWIRIPYPIREVKLMDYMKEKKIIGEAKDALLKLLYEKKLTNKVVSYNPDTGKIDNITELKI